MEGYGKIHTADLFDIWITLYDAVLSQLKDFKFM